jgi:hypothetical protein
MGKMNKIIPTAVATGIDENTIQTLQYFLSKHHNKYNEEINFYVYLKGKIEELESRLESNISFNLTVLNSKSSGKVINAKVKLPFAPNPSTKSNFPFFNIHIGKLSNYKLGLDDPQLQIDAMTKIKEYINEKFPFTILLADNQEITLNY